MKFIGGNHALLYYAAPGVSGSMPTAGAQFSWVGYLGATSEGLRIKRFRDEKTESDIVEAQMAFDYKVVAKDLGYYFFNAVE